jgi:hypothetical protein
MSEYTVTEIKTIETQKEDEDNEVWIVTLDSSTDETETLTLKTRTEPSCSIGDKFELVEGLKQTKLKER